MNRRLNDYGLGLDKCGIKIAFNLSSTKPKQARFAFVHQQIMLSNYMIARYITSGSKAIRKLIA